MFFNGTMAGNNINKGVRKVLRETNLNNITGVA